MIWSNAHVLVIETLCAPSQRGDLARAIAVGLREAKAATALDPHPWLTAGFWLRDVRDAEERAWLYELLAQPGDSGLESREAVVVEVGGRGSARTAAVAAHAVAVALCPDESHDGPCEIPWSTTSFSLRSMRSAERRRYRQLFPPSHRSTRLLQTRELPLGASSRDRVRGLGHAIFRPPALEVEVR
jgi:hypothetical protein